MGEKEVETPSSVPFFDGTDCPVCKVRLLRKERFRKDFSDLHGLDVFELEFCGSQLVLGFVLHPNLSGSSYNDAPDWVLYYHTKFVCPACLKRPDNRQRIRSFGGTFGHGVLQADLRCQCGVTTNILVVVRRWGVDPLPNVLPEQDRPPAKTEVNRDIESDFFRVHAAVAQDVLTEIGNLDLNFGDRKIWREPVKSRIELARELQEAGLLEKILEVAAKEQRNLGA